MKKIVPIIVALAALALMLCSCEKHAYSETYQNYFTLAKGESKTIGEKITISVGENVSIYASDNSYNRKDGGKYSVENNSEGIVSASASDSGVSVTGVKVGTGSVYVHWVWRGFDMHKSISFTVTE
ncbi:MAG: hypothetical protein J6W09_06405 [Bacteroidales bacterium]|jgi:hypothetical protein|nr:hypothetical protein [Bacteroidales bacterium]